MPRPTSIEDRLQTRINEFIQEISAIVRESAVDAVRSALEDGGSISASPKPRKAAKRAATRKGPQRGKGGKRIRRTAEDLEQIGSEFLSHVKDNPGQRLEEIGSALGIETSILKRPVKLLMDAKQLRTEGQRRGTKYFAGGNKARKKRATKKKASRKAARK